MKDCIDLVLPFFKTNRDWFGVAKTLIHFGYADDFKIVGEYLNELYPEGLDRNYSAADMQRMEVGSYVLFVDDWRQDDGFHPQVPTFLRHERIGLKLTVMIYEVMVDKGLIVLEK